MAHDSPTRGRVCPQPQPRAAGLHRQCSTPALGCEPACAASDAEARDEWRRVAPHLVARGLLAPCDTAVFAVYCCEWSLWLRCLRHKDKDHPVIQRIARDAEAAWSKFAKAFGMSPAARTSLLGSA
ncbi:MAG: P27 family phage terminase small subunit [Planctomycetes bacterium]|nr:P27 family phage terminase small subunit [Planctomycetota bacterium]